MPHLRSPPSFLATTETKCENSSEFHSKYFYRVTGGVEAGQQLAVDECLGVVDHQEHDDLGDQVSAGLGDDLHVGVHQVPNGLHLTLQLGVNRSKTSVLRLYKESKINGKSTLKLEKKGERKKRSCI